VVAEATLKSAAAMNENSMTRPKNVKVKKRLTRRVPMRKTNDAMALFMVSGVESNSSNDLHCHVVESLGRIVRRTMGTA
jgi:hypothetical protein